MDQSKRIVLGLIREAQESPRESDVAIVREAAKQHLEREWGKNAFWLQALGEAQALGSDPRGIQKLRVGVGQIDAAMIAKAARSYLDSRRYVEAVR